MKFREFLGKLSPTSVAFNKVQTDIDPDDSHHEVRDQDVLFSNMELRFIDPPLNNNGENSAGDFIAPGPRLLGDEDRVYNSPNEVISIAGEGANNLDYEMESDPLRGSLDDPIAFLEDQSALLFGEVYKRSRSKWFRVACIIGILSIFIIIIATIGAVILIRSECVLPSNSSTSVVSYPSKMDKGQLDLQTLLKLSWPLPDIDSYTTNQSTEVIPDDIQITNYVTQTPTSSWKVITTTTKSPRILPFVPNIMEKYVNLKTMDGSIADAKKAIKIRNASESQRMPLDPISPSAFHQYFNKLTKENQALADKGFAMQETYRSVVKRLNLTKEEIREGVILLDARIPQEWCSIPDISKSCNATDAYRTYDGSCNNRKQDRWGSSNLPYRRILFPDYNDGISTQRTLGIDGTPLPSAREISKKVHTDEFQEDYQASLMFPLWAQFVHNDLIFTPVSTDRQGKDIVCCKDGLSIKSANPDCFPISIELSNDSKVSCMPFVRSASYQGCQLRPREQLNQVSAYLDASSIYGTSVNKTISLRLGELGKLRTFHTSHKDHGGPRTLMPLIPEINDTCNLESGHEHNNYCFIAGDPRVNEVATLTALHLMWVRHHNHIADTLLSENPHWGDEKIFQETRRIVIAQIQHITYREFIPELLGTTLLTEVGLKLLTKDYYQEYDITINPSISNAFGIVFRFYHSMIQGLIRMIDTKNRNEDYVQFQKFVMNTSYIWTGGKMDEILKGISTQAAAKVDIFFSNQLTEHFLQTRNSTSGLDLVAMNIQQGRDHGLPSYLEWRKTCGLSNILKFSDLEDIWHADRFEIVSNTYKSVEDIDLFTGVLAEKHVPDGKVGPTIACIVADQFLRIRKGDRFWYEGDIQPKKFTFEQLRSIRTSTLARIICDNSDNINRIQLWPMARPTPKNPILSCWDIPKVNYGPWKEKKKRDEKVTTNDNFDSLEDSIESTKSTFNNGSEHIPIKLKDKDKGHILLDFGSKKGPKKLEYISNATNVNKV